MDRDGGLEGAGLPGDALAVEDVTRPVDDQHILGAVAVDVGDQGRGMRRRGELSGSGERAVAVAQEDRHVVGDEVGDGEVGAAVVGEVTRHDVFWFRWSRTVRVNRDRLKRWSGWR